MFPTLLPEEIDRVRRFGEVRSFAAGEALARVGEPAPGLMIILSGKVDVFQTHGGERSLIVTHKAGSFMGELAQLGGRPALVDAIASEPVEVIVIPPAQLRALLVAEAELGERIMRALILRRMGLLETGAGGPIIVGRADNGDVLRLENFLSRNGHPHQRLDPETDSCGKVLIEKFSVAPDELPLVVCPNGKVLRNPTETELARCVGLISPLDPDARSRRGGGGRRPSRTCDGGLCGIRGAVGLGARLPRVRRPSRRLGADRELSRLSHRRLRDGANGAGL